MMPSALRRVRLEDADTAVKPIPTGETNCNLFGLNEETTHLPGHRNYCEDLDSK
jgi:hypothetical protein